VNIKVSTIFFTLGLVISLCKPLILNAPFCQPKKLTKGQLKQKIAEDYEFILRQTSKIAEINALFQLELYEHIAKLINDDAHSVFKTNSVDELNNYHNKLKHIIEENDKDINRLIESLNGLKSNFNEPKFTKLEIETVKT